MKKKDDFKNKEFKVMTPFVVKEETNNGETLIVEGYANWSGDTEGNSVFVDHCGDVVVPSGMDVSIYKKNPVVLWQHNRDEVIGKALEITKKPDGIWIKAEVHSAAMEPEDFYRIKSGLVSCYSIGFRVKKVEWKEVDGKEICFITKSLLLENSIVSIPANSESSFSLVKSFGEDGFYAGELENTEEENSETNIEKEETMKLKLKDKLTPVQLEAYKTIGLEAELEKEVEVDLTEYLNLTLFKADTGMGSKMAECVRSICKDVVNEMMSEMEAKMSSKKEEDHLENKELLDEIKAVAEEFGITVEEAKELSEEEIVEKREEIKVAKEVAELEAKEAEEKFQSLFNSLEELTKELA